MHVKHFLAIALLGAAFLLPAWSDPHEQLYLSHPVQLTHDGEKSGEAYYSADGRHIIFQTVRDGHPYYQIYVMDADGSNPHMVSTGNGKTTCSFFRPDGQRIIYASTHLDPSTWPAPTPGPNAHGYQWDFDKAFDIFSAHPDGTDLTRLTDAPGYDAEDAYSPDGQHIVFTSQRDGDLEIYTMDADGKHQKRLTFMPGYDGGPFYSPDGRQILWGHFDTSTSSQVWLMQTDGTDQHPITALSGMNWAPFFHPDNQHIVFAANLERGNFELYLIDRDGNDLQRLTYNPAFDGLPVFSPDGRHVMWTSTRDGRSQIWQADFNPEALQHPLGIDPARLQQDVEFLASPALAGRGSGTPGNDEAADYVAGRFQQDGLQPAGDAGTFLQAFDVTVGVRRGPHNQLSIDGRPITPAAYSPLAFASNGRVDGDLVVAGYGMTVPQGRDDYRTVDVRHKIVVVLDGVPAGDQHLAEGTLRFKAINARQHGAAGLLVVNGPHLDPSDDVRFDSDVRAGDAGLPVARVQRSQLPIGWAALESRPRSFDTHQRTSLTVDLVRERRTTHNVVALVPGADDKLSAETIVVGAHYDHLGLGGSDSLSPDRRPQIHPGADDNASGTAAVMALADALGPLQGRLRRSVLLVAFSGEELGLLGSNYYETTNQRHIVAMLNMDMVGRLRQNRIMVAGLKTGQGFADIVAAANRASGLQVVDGGGGFGPSDHASFYLQKVPVLFFTTGVHADYHKPSDTPDKIDHDGLARVARLVFNTTVCLTGIDPLPAFHTDTGQAPNMPGEGRRSVRAAVGILPDYAAMSSQGVGIADVMPRSPAAAVGLQKGDRIVRFGDVVVHNIYDYTFALARQRPGDTVVLTVQRGQTTRRVKVVLASRHHE